MSIDVTATGVPMVGVGTWAGLYLADRTGGTWSQTQIHSSVWSEHALEIDSLGQPHLLYILNQQRYWSRRLAGTWTPVTVDTNLSNNLDFAMALDGQDRPHILYLRPGSPSQTIYGEWLGTAWQLSSPGYFGPDHAIAIDASGRPVIAYGRSQVAVGR